MAKTVALGTVLKKGTVAVGNLTSITVPGPTRAEIDVTDFDSTAAESLAGLPDNGELSLSGFFNYTDAGQAAMLVDAHNVSATPATYTIEFTRQNVKFTFSAWVKSFTPNAGGPGEAYTFDASLRVTGAVTIAPITT
jgi:hypothetical protein